MLVRLRTNMSSVPRIRIVFAVLSFTVFPGLSLPTLAASPEAVRVLLIVPPGADLAAIERARSAAPPSPAALLVAESDRVRVKGGLEMVVDLPFAGAPPADVVVLLGGEPGRAEEEFLIERRKTSRAILIPSDSPLAGRLRATGGVALILVGGSDAIPAVLEAISGAGGSERPAPRPTPAAAPSTCAATAAPASTPTRAATGRVFDRYFSSRPPTPTPTPR